MRAGTCPGQDFAAFKVLRAGTTTSESTGKQEGPWAGGLRAGLALHPQGNECNHKMTR